MPFVWQVNINRGSGGAGYAYQPVTLPSVAVGDEVIFTNNDARPHWPGLVDPVVSDPRHYFMQNQVAPGSSSSTFVAGKAGTLRYADSLDGSASRPEGTILVGLLAAEPPVTLASRGKP